MIAEVFICPPETRAEALGLLYQHFEDAARDELVAEALAKCQAGQVDLSGLWIAMRRGRLVGVLFTQYLAGRAAGLWPPEVTSTWHRGRIAALLVSEALSGLRDTGAQLVQAIIAPSAPFEASADLKRGGLPYVTDLVYMARAIDPPLEPSTAAPDLAWVANEPGTDAEFRDVLRATYQQSLDLPELEGVRRMDEVLESHRQAGRFEPSFWQLARSATTSEAVAVLLLADQPERGAVEISYVGVTPQARGRGVGRAAISHALDLARAHRKRVELAVDSRNRPALQLYKATGFAPFDRRKVHLKLLESSAPQAER